MQFFTAGESHGVGLLTLITGLPRNIKVDEKLIHFFLERRQKLGGRGARSKKEEIKFKIISGVYKGKTTGAPVSVFIPNKIVSLEQISPITTPRPGHIHLSAALKYLEKNSREFLERASARETAAKTVAGVFAKMILNEFNIYVLGYTKSIGPIEIQNIPKSFDKLRENVYNSHFALPDDTKLKDIEELIKELQKKGDTVGGTVEVIAKNVPPGLGNHNLPEEGLDTQLAKNIFAIQGVKGLEIGETLKTSKQYGSQVYGNIYVDYKTPYIFKHTQDLMGGIEGGLSNGEDIKLKVFVKPVPTMVKRKVSVNFKTMKNAKAHYESSDYCIVPAVSVICEVIVSFVIASAFLERFGSIDVLETKENFSNYLKKLRKHFTSTNIC